MKRIILGIALLCPTFLYANTITGYVQINPPISPQSGGFNTQTGAVSGNLTAGSLTAGSVTDSGLAPFQCVQTGASGILSTSGVQCGSSSGAGTSLGVGMGSPSGYTVKTSSPTTDVIVDSRTMTSALQGLATSFVGLNPSSVTLQSNTFNQANKLIRLNGSAQIPALDGSLLTGVISSNTVLASSAIAFGSPTNIATTDVNSLNWTPGVGLYASTVTFNEIQTPLIVNKDGFGAVTSDIKFQETAFGISGTAGSLSQLFYSGGTFSTPLVITEGIGSSFTQNYLDQTHGFEVVVGTNSATSIMIGKGILSGPLTPSTAQVYVTTNGVVNISTLTASQFVKTDASKNLVSYDLLNATQTWTGTNTFSSATVSGRLRTTGIDFTEDNSVLTATYTIMTINNNQPLVRVNVFDDNMGVGYLALANYGHVGGNGLNQAFGDSALTGLSSGLENTAVGYSACSTVASQNYNSCLGSQTLGGSLRNVVMGHAASAALSSHTVVIGDIAGMINVPVTTGCDNCVFIGYNAVKSTGVPLSDAIAIGASAQAISSNTMVIGGPGPDAILVQMSTFTVSSATVSGPLYATSFIGLGSVTISIGTGSGASGSPTASVAGKNLWGQVTVNTGTSPSTTATIATITPSSAMPTKWVCVLFPANAVTSLLSGATMVNVDGNTTTWTITSGATGLTGSSTYVWDYHCGGY